MNRLLPALSLLFFTACTQSAAPAPPEAAAREQGVRIPVVKLGSDAVLFTFVEGYRVRVVSKIDEVPEAVRERVLVTDLRMSAEERSAHKFNYFADLNSPQADGSFPISVVSRYDAAKGEGVKIKLPPPPEGTVVLYSAEWCGYCKKAAAWMTEKEVPFVERDVEKEPGVSAELKEKLAEKGIRSGGVPVIDWLGTLMVGFNQAKLEQLLTEKPPSKG